MKKTAISFTPFDNRNDNGQPSIGPSTQKSIVPTNNVHTIQDILNGSPYKTPGSGGDWGVGENSQPGSYKPEGADYKRQERESYIYGTYRNFNNRWNDEYVKGDGNEWDTWNNVRVNWE